MDWFSFPPTPPLHLLPASPRATGLWFLSRFRAVGFLFLGLSCFVDASPAHCDLPASVPVSTAVQQGPGGPTAGMSGQKVTAGLRGTRGCGQTAGAGAPGRCVWTEPLCPPPAPVPTLAGSEAGASPPTASQGPGLGSVLVRAAPGLGKGSEQRGGRDGAALPGRRGPGTQGGGDSWCETGRAHGQKLPSENVVAWQVVEVRLGPVLRLRLPGDAGCFPVPASCPTAQRGHFLGT